MFFMRKDNFNKLCLLKFKSENDMNLVERNKYWQTRLNEKLQQQRQSIEGKDLECCTFRPDISKVIIV